MKKQRCAKLYSYEEKCDNLSRFIDKYTDEDIMIAFSGGADSSLILKLACDSALKKNKKVYAVTLHTMLHPAGEVENAKKVAEEAGAVHMVIDIDELESAGIIDNPVDRCYLCKKYMFSELKNKASELNIKTIMEGTNEDDLHVYRPGIRAIEELGIVSPLAKTGMTKKEVRQLASELGVTVANRPAMPCLATRFPYGTVLSYEKMRSVEQGEAYIRTLGVFNVRLRVHDDIARIEVDEQDIEKVLLYKREIVEYIKSLGYSYVTIDLEGFRSGSMDINLKTQE